MTERVDGALDLVGTGQHLLHQLDGRQRPGAERGERLGGGQIVEFSHRCSDVRSASRSPRRLKATTTTTMQRPAAKASATYPWRMPGCPPLTIRPQSVAGGWTPRPMNEMAARSTMA